MSKKTTMAIPVKRGESHPDKCRLVWARQLSVCVLLSLMLALQLSLLPASAFAQDIAAGDQQSQSGSSQRSTDSEQPTDFVGDSSDAAAEPADQTTESAATVPPNANESNLEALDESTNTGELLALSNGLQVLATTNWYTSNPDVSSYTLANSEDLAGLAQLVNNGTNTFANKTLILSSDIINASLPPIGTPQNPFLGTFDGNNKNISNLTLVPASKQYVGLFGYAGQGASIQNVRLVGGTLVLFEASTSGQQIRDVGSIAGYSAGDISGCTSSITMNLNSARLAIGAPANGDDNRTTTDFGSFRQIGGLVGHLDGNMYQCAYSGTLNITSPISILEDMKYVAGEIGGLVGACGNLEDLTQVPQIRASQNSGNLTFNISGSGGIDRFGQQLYSASFGVGGIVGVTTGSVFDCTNTGNINTSLDTPDAPRAGFGGSSTGGIVGMLRGNGFDYLANETANHLTTTDPGYEIWTQSDGAVRPPTVGVYDSTNSGIVIGLSSVGGIVGGTGSFTEIEGCGNTGAVKGCRWNKPYVGGIVGNDRGDVRYSYNRGGVYSVTGAGYYCAGIAGGFSSLTSSTTPTELVYDSIEMTGCYVTGQVYTSAAGFRTGILAGESNGYIHDNAYISGLTLDDNEVHDSAGLIVGNQELSAGDLRGSKGIAKLNTFAAALGQWNTFYLPVTTAVNGGYPLPVHEFNTTGTNIDTIGVTATLAKDAIYSTAMDPVPQIKLQVGSATLLQNADYYVVPASGTKNTNAGNATYQATIKGMGIYAGTLSATVEYTIGKTNIDSCTVIAATAVFNWEMQQPAWVRVLDANGNEVDSSEYEWKILPNADGSPQAIYDNAVPGWSYSYYDYIHVHTDTYKYDVVVTAKPSSTNYEGSTRQRAFRIDWAELNYSGTTDPSRPTAIYDKVVWNDSEWDFVTALDDKSGNAIQITYTGSPIRPTFNSVTYLDREMRNGTGLPYYNTPTEYDYRYVYGNPNSEGSGGANIGTQTNASPVDTPECMTIRYTTASSFTGFTNVFYRIVPASLNLVSAATLDNMAATGEELTPDPALTYNSMTLVKNVDYTLSYDNNIFAGQATVTVTGIGNYSGTKILNFTITGEVPIHTITLKPNGGSVTPTSIPIAHNSTVGTLLPKPKRTGYDFAGWYTEATDGTGVTENTKVTTDVTFFAHWTLNTNVSVTYHQNTTPDDATIYTESGFTYGSTYTIHNYNTLGTLESFSAPSGSHFIGWYLDSDLTQKAPAFIANLGYDTHLYANYVTGDATIEEGTYVIKPKSSLFRVLDAYGGYSLNGAKIVSFDFSGAQN
ncbi:MAG: InlB B-repeat-containing protein, partial [Coriobacteriales bacterium]|nr:InlB B-repeat-containing protein [Coriobacteriales bacterium]